MIFEDKKKLLVFMAVLMTMAISLFIQFFAQNLRYERTLILTGEYWRIITCHFVHTGWNHFLLNMTGLMLLLVLFSKLYSPLCWLIGAITCIFSISLSFLFFTPQVEWYVGLSGLLHGLLAMGLVSEASKGHALYLFALMTLTIKLLAEHFSGSSYHTEVFINALVVTEAHWIGAISGSLIAIFILLHRKYLSARQTS